MKKTSIVMIGILTFGLSSLSYAAVIDCPQTITCTGATDTTCQPAGQWIVTPYTFTQNYQPGTYNLEEADYDPAYGGPACVYWQEATKSTVAYHINSTGWSPDLTAAGNHWVKGDISEYQCGNTSAYITPSPAACPFNGNTPQ